MRAGLPGGIMGDRPLGSLPWARLCAPRGAQMMIGNCHRAGAAPNGGPACVTSGSPHIRSLRFRPTLAQDDGTTRLEYSGELGTDFGIAGRWWADWVAAAWEAAVRSSLKGIRAEAERRTRT